MKLLMISRGGQISIPASIRKRWGTKTVSVEDLGDHVVIRPAPDDPIAAARGALVGKTQGLSLDELRRLAREDERRAEDREWGSSSTPTR